MHQYDGASVQGNWRRDLYDAIKNSEKFIYLCVPSLNPNTLIYLDESDDNKSVTIGELLKEKRYQGENMRYKVICSKHYALGFLKEYRFYFFG